MTANVLRRGLMMSVVAFLVSGCGLSTAVGNRVNWVVNSHQKVHIFHRDYLLGSTMSLKRARARYGPLTADGHFLGLTILEKPGTSAHPEVVPTILILERNPHTCLIYGLSGGP